MSILGRSSAVLALNLITNEGSAFVRNLILARLIGVEQMGLAVALALTIRLVEMIGDFGLERWLVQLSPGDLDRARGTAHLLQVIKGLALTGLAWAVATPLIATVQPELSSGVFLLAAASIAIRGFINLDYRERQRDGDFVSTLKVEGGSNLISLLAIAPIAIASGDYSALAWASLVQAMAFCVISRLVATRPVTFRSDAEMIRQGLRFGVPVACNGALVFLAMQGDRLIVASFFEPAVLAAFAIAAQLALLPALIGARFLLTFDMPSFARLAEESDAWLRLFARRLLFVTLGASLMALALATGGDAVVGLLYGPEFVSAPGVMALLGIAAALRLIRGVPTTALMASGRTAVLLFCNLPRVIALPIALMSLSAGGGLVTILAIGAASEAASLLLALAILHIARRNRAGLTQLRIGTSS